MEIKKKLIPLKSIEHAMVLLIAIAINFGLLGCCKCEDQVNCERGKVVNCVCDCPTGWEGPTCNEEIIPKSMTITSVAITKIPEENSSGNTWDIQADEQDPDLMLILWKDDNFPNQDWSEAWDEDIFSGIKKNRDPSTIPIIFNLKNNSVLNFPSRHYRLSLYDDDGPTGFNNTSEEQLIGGITFTPYTKGSGFPTTLTYSSGNVSFELNVKYTWP